MYLAEISDLGRDSEGESKKALTQHIAERRANFKFLVPLLGSNPEMGAAAFYGAKVDPALARKILTSDEDTLPLWEDIQSKVTFPKECQNLIPQVEDPRFLVITAGLEWARQNQKLVSI